MTQANRINIEAVTCAKCNRSLPPRQLNQGWVDCASCGAAVVIELFPALFRNDTVEAAPAGLDDGDAHCYYHESRSPAVVCDACGRFLCELCKVELGDRSVCPGCLEAEMRKGADEQIVRRRVRYANIALALAVFNLGPGFVLFGLPGLAAVVLSVISWFARPAVYQSSRLANRVTGVVAAVIGLGSAIGIWALWLSAF